MNESHSSAFPPKAGSVTGGPAETVVTGKPGADEEAIEPEIVDGPMPGARGARKDESLTGRFRSFILRIKILFSAAIVLMALALIIIGAALTSTFIGAVLGIPLMLAGGLLIWLLFKALTLGKTKNFFVFTQKIRPPK